MPKVDILKIEKEAQSVKETASDIATKTINGKNYFKGKFLPDWYDNYQDCHNENQVEASKVELKKLGYNEDGQSPEQVRILKAVKSLVEKKIALTKEIQKLEAEISRIKTVGVKEVKEPKKK